VIWVLLIIILRSSRVAELLGAKMPFPQAVQSTEVGQGDTATCLWASIQGPDAGLSTSALRLDDMIGNNNGSLAIPMKDFTKTARNIKIMGNNNSQVSSAAS
jgi:hypothetical protein